eukprot:TRINITY_DN1237_c0_g1_i2.p1 TRINITY_DN1237_c0_g1~~TRINITY_DN1237_c0_g1_i2.p1  ORF type:complete len:126 (+),score=14.91 TRINITY_DN1237_c0_g1_i2:269-646(+)
MMRASVSPNLNQNVMRSLTELPEDSLSLTLNQSAMICFIDLSYLPPDNSMAEWLYSDSSPQSNLLWNLSCSCLRVTSTCCHSSHLSANPSPSSIRTTSDIGGRSSGDACVQSKAIWIIISTSWPS